MSRVVDEGYINNYFTQQEKIIARLKEVAQIMCDNSDEYEWGPYQIEWEEESIEMSIYYVTLKLSSPEPYEDWDNEECYNIPYGYLTASYVDIEDDVRSKTQASNKQDREQEVRTLRAKALFLGYDLVDTHNGCIAHTGSDPEDIEMQGCDQCKGLGGILKVGGSL